MVNYSSSTHAKKLVLCLFLCALVHNCKSGIARRKLHRAKADGIHGQYYVHFKRETTISEGKEVIDAVEEFDRNSLMPDFNATVFGVLIKTGHGFAAKLSPEALKYVMNHDKVNFVEEDSYIQAATQLRNFNSSDSRTTQNWGIDRMDTKTNDYDGHYTPPCGLTGQNVDVYVVDSGLYYDHVQFGGRAKFSGCDSIDVLYSTTLNNGTDCSGHGTIVAGVIGGSETGVAIGATILSVRVLNCNGEGSWNSILLGLECVLNKTKERKNRSAVVNLSVTGASKNRAIKRAIDKLIDSGITVVGISGNTKKEEKSRNSCKTMPGSIPGVITVAGSTRNDEIFNKTQLGRCVDIFGPGKDIQSLCTNDKSCITPNIDGSSVAGPHVTGAIALLLEKCPKLPPWKVRYYLQTAMSVPNVLRAKGIVPNRYVVTTPNLLVHTGPEMCSIPC